MAEKITEKRESFSCSLISQGTTKFYSLTMPSEILADTCFVSTRDENPQDGFQRMLDKSRAQEIADYIDSGAGSIPTAIILSAQTDAGLQYSSKNKTIEFNLVPNAFLILDGQHRIYGFSLAKTSVRVPVIIYNGLSRKEETRLFVDINTKQRPVPSELVLDIKSLSVFLLVVSGFEEQRRDLLVAFLLGLGRKIGVLVACLGLTGKGSHQVFFGLSTCVFCFFHGRCSFHFFPLIV